MNGSSTSQKSANKRSRGLQKAGKVNGTNEEELEEHFAAN